MINYVDVEHSNSVAARFGGESTTIQTVKRMAGYVLSFEMAYLLFLFGGVYNNDPRFSFFPGDITVAFLGLSIGVGMLLLAVPAIRARNPMPGSRYGGLYRQGFFAVAWALAFVLWIIFSKSYTPSVIYAGEKLFNTSIVAVWCTVAGALIMAKSRTRVERFLLLLVILGTVVGIDNIIKFASATFNWKQSNYLTLGRLAGLAAIVSFAFWLRSPLFSTRGFLFLMAFCVNCYMLLIAGGRGPTAGMAMSLMAVPLLSIYAQPKRLLIHKDMFATMLMLLALIAAVVYLLFFSEESFRTLDRFRVLLTGDDVGQSAAERIDFWKKAVLLWYESPWIGHGIGSFPIYYENNDDRAYPHNLILELLAEFGIIGLVLFGALVFSCVYRMSFSRMRKDPILLCAFLLFLNTLINSMSSGDLADNRNLFMALALLAVRPLGDNVNAGTESRPSDIGAPGLRHQNI